LLATAVESQFSILGDFYFISIILFYVASVNSVKKTYPYRTVMATAQSAFSFDWNLCIFCQRALPNVKTVCPAKSTRADVGSGYRSLAEAVKGFSEIGHLDVDFVNFWDDGDGIESTCIRHQACWHAKCRSSLHPTKLA